MEREEKSLSDELKYDNSMLDNMTQRAKSRTATLEEIRSSIFASEQLRESMKKKQEKLDAIRASQLKLVESQMNK